jgi:hypothetical protein
MLSREDVWTELVERGASIAVVPFRGQAGRGGRTGRIVLLRGAADALTEVESWTSRDELCYALEAPVWARFGSFAGQPLIAGEVTWFVGARAVEIVAKRSGRHVKETVR